MVKGIGALLEANPGSLWIVLVKLIYIYKYIYILVAFWDFLQHSRVISHLPPCRICHVFT